MTSVMVLCMVLNILGVKQAVSDRSTFWVCFHLVGVIAAMVAIEARIP